MGSELQRQQYEVASEYDSESEYDELDDEEFMQFVNNELDKCKKLQDENESLTQELQWDPLWWFFDM